MAEKHVDSQTGSDSHIRSAAHKAGITDRFEDAFGVARTVPIDALKALLSCLGSQASATPPLPQVTVARAGATSFTLRCDPAFKAPATGRIVFEDAQGDHAAKLTRETKQRLKVTVSTPLPVGTHQFRIGSGSAARKVHVLAAPQSLSKSVTTAGHQLAVFMPLYAVKGRGGIGVGTYTDLRHLVDWADTLGSSLVGTLPLFPSFLKRPFCPSPYAPITRLLWSELFIDPRQSPEWSSPSVLKAASNATFRSIAASARRGDWVDYKQSWSLLRKLLVPMSKAAKASPARWKVVVEAAGPSGASYAAFRATSDHRQKPWTTWPTAQREGRLTAAAYNQADSDFYLYAQALANTQMSQLIHADGSKPLYLDLPVGVHPEGYDVWRRPDLFLNGVSAGAPPDALYTGGQVWGFPPMHPAAGRVDGYDYLRAVLRKMLSVAGVLRIDHIMGLLRIYCVPPGFDGTQGAYLHYPAEELFAVVLIEAARAGALVVGEDLGTVPPKIRSMMHQRGFMGMHVQQFSLNAETKAISLPPPSNPFVLASLNTHDTPTFGGFWAGDDITLRTKLNLIDPAGERKERKERAALRRAVSKDLKRRRMRSANAKQVGDGLMVLHAKGPAAISLVNLEDLWGERRPQNVPGTDTEFPNWRRRGLLSLAELTQSEFIAQSLRTLSKARPKSKASTRKNRK